MTIGKTDRLTSYSDVHTLSHGRSIKMRYTDSCVYRIFIDLQ